MSEIANALIITSYSRKVARAAQESPANTLIDVENDLWYAESPEEIERAYSSYALFNLGHIAASQYFDTVTALAHHGPRIDELELRFAELLPELRRPITSKQIGSLSLSIEAAELGLPKMMILPILHIPSLRDELLEKWSVAEGVYAQRAISLVPGDDRYNRDF